MGWHGQLQLDHRREAGRTVMATLWLADGAALGRERGEQLIDSARAPGPEALRAAVWRT